MRGLQTLLRYHEHAFHCFGGLPQEVLYDKHRTGVLRRDLDNFDPQFEECIRRVADQRVQAPPIAYRRRSSLREAQLPGWAPRLPCPDKPDERGRPGPTGKRKDNLTRCLPDMWVPGWRDPGGPCDTQEALYLRSTRAPMVRLMSLME
jgi:hypothetical protein